MTRPDLDFLMNSPHYMYLGNRQSGAFRSFFAVSFLILFSDAVSMALAQEPAPEYHFKNVEQSAQGVMWAIDTHLHLFNGKEWGLMPVYFPVDENKIDAETMRLMQGPCSLGYPWYLALLFDEGMLMRLTPMQDGSMACVWQLPENRFAVTRHNCAGLQMIGVCHGEIKNSGLTSPPFADSHNRLWITDAKPEIYRADSDRHVALVYTIKPEQLLDANDLEAHYGNLFSSEDGRGRIWVWSNSWRGGMNGAALRGVLIFDGDKVTQQEKFNGINGTRYSFIDREDGKRMWVAVIKEGVFSVDIDTMEAKPLAEPEPGAFQWVKKIFSSKGDLFIIAACTGQIFKNILWRFHDGKWTRLIENVDNRFNPSCDFDRSWLRIGSDILLCAHDSTPWLIHKDGSVERLDFQHGFTIEDARRIFLLSDGRLLVQGAQAQNFCGKVSLAPASGKPSRATELLFTAHGWTTDADGNVWAVLLEKGNILSQWDGREWHEHPFPDDLQQFRFLGASVDTRGRVWLLPHSRQTGFFDPDSGKWRTFSDMEAALTEMKSDPPQFVGERPEFCAPDYSSDLQRVAFRPISWEVVYFDGEQWHRWKRAEIDGSTNRNSFTLGPPFFDKSDHLCVCIGKDTWQLDDQGRWQKKDVEVKYPDDTNGAAPRQQKVAPPDGCVTDSPDSTAADNQGGVWLTWQGKLYRCGFGRCVEVFPNGEPNPFTDHRKITDAWVDNDGNAFLQTAFDKQIMIKPKSPPPKLSMAPPSVETDSVTARLQTGSHSILGFRWRLDDGAWQLSKNPVLVMDSLPTGGHTLTAQAIDDELQASPAVSVTFTIQIDPQKQLAMLIKRLADPDFDKRKSAIAALSRQPEAALPALKAARENAGDEQRWWIDAAIQEIERHMEKATMPASRPGE